MTADTTDMRRRHIAIIGGGPAGLMAAETLARAGVAVTLFERMPSVGRKFLMAGRGGLNLTHSEPLADFTARYRPAEASLEKAVCALPPLVLRDWCAELGEETFVGSSGRVFPKSFKASPLLRAWLRRLEELGVTIKTRHRWTGFGPEGHLLIEDADGAPLKVQADATILALGGASWPRLGADGAWVRALRDMEVDVAPLRPANAGIIVPWTDHYRERFAGDPLKRVGLTHEGRQVVGEANVTWTGLEGGAVYSLFDSLRERIARFGEAQLIIDLRPDTSGEVLRRRLGESRRKASLSNRLRQAGGLSPAQIGLLREGTLAAKIDINSQSDEQLAALIKAVALRVTGTQGLERAISTAGGVRFSALDSNLMVETRPGLFIAGEMLDWEAPTGGYLLQAAFATGAAAARGALSHLAGLIPGRP